MTEPTKDQLRLLVDVTDEGNHYGSYSTAYLKLNVSFIYDTDEGLRNPSSGSWDRSPYANLYLTGQLDDQSATRQNEFYGRDVEYRNVYSADLKAIEQMVKELRKINRYMEQHLAYSDDTATHIALLASAVGIRGPRVFARRIGEDRGGLYSNNSYTWMNKDALRSWLTTRVDEFCTKWHVVKELDPAVVGLQQIRDDLEGK